jgi:uncharacterized protein
MKASRPKMPEMPALLQQWKDSFTKISYLNGHRFRLAIIAAARELIANQDYLNKINVFPVPDGDTGTNMASTLHTIIVALRSSDQPEIDLMSQIISDSALEGARGNSGVILAQFFYGLAMELEGKKNVNTREFAQAVESARQQSYSAMADPREGTILSVISEFSQCWRELSETEDNYAVIMAEAQNRCQAELERSPYKLKVLGKAKVLDAGAQGFVNMLEGINKFIQGGKVKEMVTDFLDIFSPLPKEVDVAFDPDVKYRYCTECIVDGSSFDRETIRQQLQELGDSLILAGSLKRLKLHIHTDEPEKVFEILEEYGSVRHKKADDMKKQVQSRRENRGIAIVVDSTSDLSEELLQENNIHVVPVRLSFGNQSFIDQVTITSSQFYTKLKAAVDLPKTSQPAPRDFENMYRYLSSHYREIISLHVSQAMSGTIQSAEKATSALDQKRIHIFDSRATSLSLGILAIKAAHYLNEGLSAAEIIRLLEKHRDAGRVYILFDTLEFVIRGGRLNPSVGKILSKIGLMPILTFNKKGLFAKAGFARRGSSGMDKIIAKVRSELKDTQATDIGIIHANAPEKGRLFLEKAKAAFPNARFYFNEIGPALGVHAGPGTLGIVVFKTI